MSHKYTTVAALLFGTAVLPRLASAQEGERLLKKELAADGQPALIEFKATARPSAADGAFVLRQQLGLGQHEQMRPVRLETDELGFTHQKFEQFYQGVKIEHATYTVHARSGAVESLSGDYEKVGQLSTTPGLSASAALGRALAAVGAKKYMWQDAAEQASLRQQTGNASAGYQPQGELVIVRDQRQDAETGPLVLAWKFDIYAQQPVSRAYYYVNAQTGDIVLRDDIIKHTTHATAAAATGSFATAYSGTRSLATETATGGYRLREYTRGLGIETYNLKKGTNYGAAVDFVDADNNWTAAEYNNANFDNAAGDAHFGAQATYDYWKATHNRNSYNNAGAKILSYVHYGNSYENAFWDGTRMTYGDGASTFRPLTSLDVCGHEIGHAVCSNTANLTYSYESGAMNEGFSDIWGACVEKYAADKFTLSGKSTWDIGEEIIKAGGALRSMSNPNLYNQPAYYKGLKWYAGSSDNGGVHYNSGVLNYWFYLISVGKTGTNEKGAAYSVAALGITNAARIAYRAESVYLTASSNYAAARTATIQAATDLFGAGSTQVTAVTNAWNAVGVGVATTSGYCASKGTSQAYEWIDYVAIGSIARTSAADGGYYDGSALTTSVAANTSQTISYSAAFKSTAYTEYFRIYADWNQDGDFSDAGETIVSAAASSVATTRSSTFTVPSTARNGKVRLRVVMSYDATTTSCGTYSYGETEDYTLTVTGGVGTSTIDDGVAGLTTASPALDAAAKLSLYPNPATDALHLSLSSGAELQTVDVLDARGAKASVRYLGSGEVSLSGLAPGLYVLRASDGQHTFTKRFAKQ